MKALRRIWHCVIRNRHDMEPRIAHTNAIPPKRIPEGREYSFEAGHAMPQELPFARCRRCQFVALRRSPR